jgi:hypothetical protein
LPFKRDLQRYNTELLNAAEAILKKKKVQYIRIDGGRLTIVPKL